MHVAWGIPRRMARAMDAVFKRDGRTKHQGKFDLLRDLMRGDDRIPLATDTGAITGEPAIWHAAETATRAVHGLCHQLQTADAIIAAIAVECSRRGIAPPLGDTEKEQITRALDKAWWRRHLRTEWKRRFEHTSIQLGLTSVRNDPYVSRETAILQERQNRANVEVLENRIATNEHGQSYPVSELAALGTGNKTIRRGELMTRIRGFEEVAEDRRDVGVFWTQTCPSKFHSVGGTNVRYNGATPRDAQAYMVKVWARQRAALHRVGIRPYGFRIAEPHTDGCPHWHMLLFVEREQAFQMEAVMRAYALAEDGDEPGADKNRVKVVRIEAGKGTAAGYIAKYVSKNIDGAGVGDHKSFENGTTYVVAPDRFGDIEITPSARVTYWAQVWGIRQFQQIGGAPVGVWRELRRIKADAVQQAPEEIKKAWSACQKIESDDPAVAQQASFAAYMDAQGGPTVGRRAAIKIATREVTIKGRYATYEDKKPVGVFASAFPNEVYESVRYRWTIEQKDGAGVALDSPWTGVNNCTPPASDGGAQWNGEAFNVKETRPENVQAYRDHSPRYQAGHLNHLRRKHE